MRFRIVSDVPVTPVGDTVYLARDNWDDYSFRTSFMVVYIDRGSGRHELGSVKIGQIGLEAAQRGDDRPGRRSPDLDPTFQRLARTQFSLGQDREYYEAIARQGRSFREEYLAAMNDLTILTNDRLGPILQEEVTRLSLLRAVPLEAALGQFRRIAEGGDALIKYDITYTLRRAAESRRLTFEAIPNSSPPTNVHVLIGNNGIGKSTILNDMARDLVRADDRGHSFGSGVSNVVSVSFSAFDTFDADLPTGARPLPRPDPGSTFDLGDGRLTYRRVGLPTHAADHQGRSSGDQDPVAGPEPMLTAVLESVQNCLRQNERCRRLISAIRRLEIDPILNQLDLSGLVELRRSDVPTVLTENFPGLSSGHKIVLLSVISLVETVEEASLVLLDEPESHLHPPLLSAYIRALSDLLVDRNGLAIIATHSPVVLQEVPRSCVWTIRRNGAHVQLERPQIETFGENVGVLTDQVFGRQVYQTGYHKMLAEAARTHESYDAALDSLQGQLGSEGRAILRTMINHRHDVED